ncbi:MAG: PQQ-dependent sugar dehydrogenase [Fimbriimonadaceae bacterium]|nr:PQQ-dependent sugar dehydrogenase [Fimbriimonadaceae bacterium]
MRTVFLGGAAVAAFGCACLAPNAAKSAPSGSPMPALEFQQRSATALWEQNCRSCHGDRGQGGGAGTRTLLTQSLYDHKLDRRFFDAIKQGVPDTAMTAFGDTMSDEQIWSLVVHTRELQAAALRPRRTSEEGVNVTNRARFRVETVLEGQGLKTPWSVDWLPNGDMLVTNRPGTMFVTRGDKVLAEVKGLPAVTEKGQGGLMDVAVHPQAASNGWIYLAFTESKGGGAVFTRLVRGKLETNASTATWTGQQDIWSTDASNYSGSGIHFGCRIVFDGKGHIFFGVGERGSGDRAQDLKLPNGKIYRLNEDGTVPSDNPFLKTTGALGAVWSFGHRNPQGLVFDLGGKLWDTEHGPRGGDELNEILPGKNYGWPVISYGINYNDSPYRQPWNQNGFQMPEYRWLPSTGVCGLDVARGPMFEDWKGDILAGGLSGQCVDRIRVKDGRFVEVERIFSGLGRVRDVVSGPGGAVYVVLNEPDKVVRLVEAD